MGASLSLAIRKKELGCEVTGVVRSEKSRAEGMSLNITDKIFLEEDFLKSNSWNEYDLIIFSLPVDLTCDKIDLIPETYKGYITDLGSTKKFIIDKVESKFKAVIDFNGKKPINPSGGLIGVGHPVGASGVLVFSFFLR